MGHKWRIQLNKNKKKKLVFYIREPNVIKRGGSMVRLQANNALILSLSFSCQYVVSLLSYRRFDNVDCHHNLFDNLFMVQQFIDSSFLSGNKTTFFYWNNK